MPLKRNTTLIRAEKLEKTGPEKLKISNYRAKKQIDGKFLSI
nr:hypothetical protein [Mycoplasmopsis bovis]